MPSKPESLNLSSAPVRCRTGVGAVVSFKGSLAVNRQRVFVFDLPPLLSLARDFSGPF